MAFTFSTSNGDSKGDGREGILQNIRDIIRRVDPRGSYHIEPTWRINGIPISRCTSPDLPRMAGPRRLRKYDYTTRFGSSSFRSFIRGLHSSELREIIMNMCLKSFDVHRDVIDILKRMQRKRPRPICLGGRIQNPTAGMYLYCRNQRELVDIVLELEANDDSGSFKQDVRDLVAVMQEKEGNRHDDDCIILAE
ncbi:hypothetical protein GGS21DRAFT_492867 [Xylaria nigripes]|nr:hypothetical protein GGS21DRAFT_492867 [Xylaria nigripes]